MVSALDRWRTVLPAGRVRTAPVELARAATATFGWPRRVTAILAPDAPEQVREILRIAQVTRHAVYPCSRGCNWGLGSRLPAADDCALLDLSGMNRILDHDAELGTLTVEPGVHFAQASAFLRARQSRFYCSVTGGPAYGSLIGNALERGGGDGPLGDRAAHMAALEVMLAGGEVIHTGFDRYARAGTARLSRTGVGPSLTELMAQSNFGVVTRATIWLAQRPATWRLAIATVASTATLGPALDAVRELIQSQVLYANAVTLWNSYKMRARDGQFPWDQAPRLPLDIGATEGAEPWYVSVTVEGASERIVEALLAEVQRLLAPCSLSVEVLRDSELSAAERAPLEPGVPTGANVFSAYWRKKGALPALEDLDPDRDRCGVIWLCPSLPLLGATAAPVLAEVERRIRQHGLEPNIGLNPVSPRLLDVYVALMFDLELPGEDERAMACHHSVMRWLIEQGHLPYRLGVQSFGMLPRPADDSAAVMARLKRAFDPLDIVAPGRYAA
jgi:4-cresol dehydrogenase (hydroxylating)